MKAARAPRFKIGTKINRDLTVLGAIRTRGRYPVYIVWNHADWAPMACKVFSVLNRAQREADILAALEHPNIVRLFGVAEPALLLMEFLEGPTLETVVDEMPRADEHFKRDPRGNPSWRRASSYSPQGIHSPRRQTP